MGKTWHSGMSEEEVKIVEINGGKIINSLKIKEKYRVVEKSLDTENYKDTSEWKKNQKNSREYMDRLRLDSTALCTKEFKEAFRRITHDEFRFFAGLKRFNKMNEHSSNNKDYDAKRWLKRLCVLKLNDADYDGNATLSVYKSRNSWWKIFWEGRRKKRPSSDDRSENYEATAVTQEDLMAIDLTGKTPCRVLTLEHFPQEEVTNLKE